jgi:hypothetical protein
MLRRSNTSKPIKFRKKILRALVSTHSKKHKLPRQRVKLTLSNCLTVNGLKIGESIDSIDFERPIAGLQYTLLHLDGFDQGQLGRDRYSANAVTSGVSFSF